MGSSLLGGPPAPSCIGCPDGSQDTAGPQRLFANDEAQSWTNTREDFGRQSRGPMPTCSCPLCPACRGLLPRKSKEDGAQDILLFLTLKTGDERQRCGILLGPLAAMPAVHLLCAALFAQPCPLHRHTQGNQTQQVERPLCPDKRDSQNQTAHCLGDYRRYIRKTLCALKEKNDPKEPF